MEYIAIRESMGREHALQTVENRSGDRRVLNQQHPGQPWGAAIPAEITPHNRLILGLPEGEGARP